MLQPRIKPNLLERDVVTPDRLLQQAETIVKIA